MTADQYRQDTDVDPKLLAEWTEKNAAARRAYYEKPSACTRQIYKGGYR